MTIIMKMNKHNSPREENSSGQSGFENGPLVRQITERKMNVNEKLLRPCISICVETQIEIRRARFQQRVKIHILRDERNFVRLSKCQFSLFLRFTPFISICHYRDRTSFVREANSGLVSAYRFFSSLSNSPLTYKPSRPLSRWISMVQR